MEEKMSTATVIYTVIYDEGTDSRWQVPENTTLEEFRDWLSDFSKAVTTPIQVGDYLDDCQCDNCNKPCLEQDTPP